MSDRHDPKALLSDPGVLNPSRLLEFGGWQGAEKTGGVAILPWRSDWLQATAASVEAHPDASAIEGEQFNQALVHLQKSRDATWQDLCSAWRLLIPGGRLLLCGGNDLGIVSAVKRLAKELQQTPQILSNRRRARIVAFEQTDHTSMHPASPESHPIWLPIPGQEPVEMEAAAGAFSAKKIDSGTQLLLDAIAHHDATPELILDMACGIGTLALAALIRWPSARAVLADADARAVASAQRNADRIGVGARARTFWWDAHENFPAEGGDLLLLNPPFHTGKAVDLAPARAMFKRAEESLRPGATALLVANRTLPYEKDLEALGRLRILSETRHYKLLSARKRSRSSVSSKRHSPGPSSRGRS